MPRIGVKRFRPPGCRGKGDKQLEKIHSSLLYLFKKIHKTLDKDDPLRLPQQAYDQVASFLVELTEDLYNDIGIWRSYEQHNLECFGTPLPLHLDPKKEIDPEEMYRRRIQHALWNLYPLFDPDLILPPAYDKLYELSEQIAQFLQEKFADMPHDSGVKKFLSEPVKFGWDVKKKLVWLGTGSYLFRYLYGDYVAEQGGQADIPTTDDFICQETTFWSGLGTLDILAGILDITEKQRRDLRSWYERHLAFYRVKALHPKKGTMDAINLINDRPYRIRAGENVSTFTVGMCVQGSLVPWNSEWYWSGGQSAWDSLPKKAIKDVKKTFAIKMSNIVYRYCNDLLKEARKTLDLQYDDFLKYHGSDLILYPDGPALAKDFEKQIRSYNESRMQELGKSKKPSSVPNTNFTVPEEYFEMQNGVAVFFNPDEGQEIMQEFNTILSGLEKRGMDLSEDEEMMIQEFMFSDAISPAFIKRVVEEYGQESIAAAFFLEPEMAEDDLFLEYLLRKYKGHFYRKRYPAISIMPEM